MVEPRDDITSLLRRIARGERDAREEAFALLYRELHDQAECAMRGQPGRHTLQATALVHEMWIKIEARRAQGWNDRRHFLATASHAMRQVLVDHARARRRLRREPPGEQEPLDRIVVSYEERALDLVALDDALRRLAEFNPDMAQAVELRFFAGASSEEAAEILGISSRTFERRWSAARTWLRAELE